MIFFALQCRRQYYISYDDCFNTVILTLWNYEEGSITKNSILHCGHQTTSAYQSLSSFEGQLGMKNVLSCQRVAAVSETY